MITYLVECVDNGFSFEFDSLVKVCEVFNLNQHNAYNGIRNLQYNHQGKYTPSSKKNIKISKNDN